MIEGWGDNLEQSKFIEAMSIAARSAYKVVQQIQEKTLAKESKPLVAEESEETEGLPPKLSKVDIDDLFQELAYAKIYDVLTDYTHDKISRDLALSKIRNQTVNAMLKNPKVSNDPTLTYTFLSEQYFKFIRKVLKKLVLNESKRADGRKLDELRPISCRANMFKQLHGSALFQRGQTQVLCSVTFDSPDSMYKPEAISNMMSPSLTNFNKNFMLHYEFPAFATNEIARVGGRADRREIGHGALAG